MPDFLALPNTQRNNRTLSNKSIRLTLHEQNLITLLKLFALLTRFTSRTA